MFDSKRKIKILLAYDPRAIFDEVKVLETASGDRSLHCTKVGAVCYRQSPMNEPMRDRPTTA
jgi:hypothetical protein